MKITKYPQSCLKIEDRNRAILVDVGTLATAEFKIADFGKFDAVLFTHRHFDHLDVSAIDELMATGATIYGNADVADAVGGDRVEVVEDGEELIIAGFKVKSCDLEHCLMVDGSEGVLNTSYLIDDFLLLPGDSVEPKGLKAEVVAAPIFGPDISFHDAYVLADKVGANEVIPVHFDVAKQDPETFVKLGGDFHGKFKVTIIPNGETATFNKA